MSRSEAGKLRKGQRNPSVSEANRKPRSEATAEVRAQRLEKARAAKLASPVSAETKAKMRNSARAAWARRKAQQQINL